MRMRYLGSFVAWSLSMVAWAGVASVLFLHGSIAWAIIVVIVASICLTILHPDTY